jgi:hypothetical protein
MSGGNLGYTLLPSDKRAEAVPGDALHPVHLDNLELTGVDQLVDRGASAIQRISAGIDGEREPLIECELVAGFFPHAHEHRRPMS